jgi:hypothetical protein
MERHGLTRRLCLSISVSVAHTERSTVPSIVQAPRSFPNATRKDRLKYWHSLEETVRSVSKDPE